MKSFFITSNDEVHLRLAEVNQLGEEPPKYKYIIIGDVIDIGDEYHTIHELYQHRMALNIALFNQAHMIHQSILGEKGADTHPVAMKSKFHADGTMFDGYFIVMLITPEGQVSYHYKLKHWDKFKIPEIDKTPAWDGHTSYDVLNRLMKI